MNIAEILAGGGGALLVVLTLIQIAPIKIDPWTAIFRAIGKAFNGDVMDKLDALSAGQQDTQRALDEHIRSDEYKTADETRGRILRFNNELLRDLPHTREEFIEILNDIDFYEQYCRDHEDYKNNRATHAIANIGRVYDERLKKRDFL